MNLMLCDSCGNRNVICFNCERNNNYRESNRSHDAYIRQEAIKEFSTNIINRLEEKSFWINPIPYEDRNYACKVIATDQVIKIVKCELSWYYSHTKRKTIFDSITNTNHHKDDNDKNLKNKEKDKISEA